MGAYCTLARYIPMSTQSPDRLQQFGTIVAIILGVWGAGLSTYQELRTHVREKPAIYTQLTVSRPDYVENAKSRPATFAVNVSNSGQAPVTVLPGVSFVAFNPASGFSKSFTGQITSGATYSLPKTLQPGEQIAATASAAESDSLFGPNMQYAVLVQTADNQLFYSEYIVGPIKTAEAFEALQKAVKYQAKVEFGSKPAIPVSR